MQESQNNYGSLFLCPILNAGRGNLMHTNHKTQYKPIKKTTPEHQKQNQTRTPKTDTERENTNGKRKQPKNRPNFAILSLS